MKTVQRKDDECDCRQKDLWAIGSAACDKADPRQNALDDDVPVSFAGTVGVDCTNEHCNRTQHVQSSHNESDISRREVRRKADDVWQRENIGVVACEHQEKE